MCSFTVSASAYCSSSYTKHEHKTMKNKRRNGAKQIKEKKAREEEAKNTCILNDCTNNKEQQHQLQVPFSIESNWLWLGGVCAASVVCKQFKHCSGKFIFIYKMQRIYCELTTKWAEWNHQEAARVPLEKSRTNGNGRREKEINKIMMKFSLCSLWAMSI